MKKKLFLFVSLLIGCYYLYSFTSQSEKYKIINEIAKDNNLMLSDICSESINIEIFENNVSHFSFFDQLSVNARKITQYGHHFKNDELKYLDRKSNKLKASKILEDCKTQDGIFYKISLPIVSSDKKTAVLKITETCNCMLGGQSGEYLYKKTDGKWKKIKTLNGWIS